jgi:uncharacterized membrane protein (DUF4010 family)
LFVLFSLLTYFTIQYFGKGGLNILSLIVGVSDIDPFLLNLFQGAYALPAGAIAAATMQAILSNNILKLFYIYFLADRKVFRQSLPGYGAVILVNLAAVAVLLLRG